MRKLQLLALSAFLTICRTITAGPSSNDITILSRDTWSFSAEEIKTLNGCAVEVFQKTLVLSLRHATNYIMEIMAAGLKNGRLVEFHVIDLNYDGIAEMLLSVDDSGRGVMRNISVLSRKSGQYYCQGIPVYGGTIKLMQNEKQNLIVGSSPLFELTRADPIRTFPILYSWTGSQCKDVSRENKAYYEAQYLPALTNALFRSQDINLSDEGESKRRVLVEVIGLALATEKLTSMFPDHLVATNEVAKLDKLMERFTLDGEQDAVLLGKFREAHNHLRGYLRQR